MKEKGIFYVVLLQQWGRLCSYISGRGGW